MLLRKVERRRWDWVTNPDPWLSPGEIPAAPLADFHCSTDSKVSVWHVDSDKSNLSRIIAAMAANRNSADKFDYVLFPDTVLTQAGITAKPVRGESKDEEANEKWHRDLVEVSGAKLIKLVQLLATDGEMNRASEKQVVALIKTSIQNGSIDKAKLPESLAKHLAWNIPP